MITIRSAFMLIFSVAFLLITTAGGVMDTTTTKSLESMVLTIGLGATLAIFLAGSFAFLMRWVLTTTQKRETEMRRDMKETREAFVEALRKIDHTCPMREHRVQDVFDRELGRSHQAGPSGDTQRT